MSYFAAIKTARRKILRRFTTELAYLGDGNGNIRAEVGKVWIRKPCGVDENGEVLLGEPVPCNPGYGYIEYEGAPVRTQFDENDELTIVRADEKELRSAGYDLRMINPGNPQNKYFRLSRAVRLMCRAVGNNIDGTSALVAVRSWIYQTAYGDIERYVGTPTQSDKLDIITGYTPTAGYHRVVVVFFRQIDQTLQVFGSTEQAQTTALDMTDYEECFDQSYIDEDVPVQAFHLEDAQTVVDNRDLGIDLRMFLQGQPRMGEETVLAHNRYLRSEQTIVLTKLVANGYCFVAMGTLLLLADDTRIVSAGGTFGDAIGGDYSCFEDDGTYRMEGDATVWDDLAIAVSSVRVPASAAPTWTAYKGSQVLAFSPTQDNIIYFSAQLKHGYQEGTDIEFHLHLAYPDSNAGVSVWNFTYSWANMGDDFPAETLVTTDITSPADQDNHQYAQIEDSISGTGKEISSVLLCSIEREGTNGDDTYASNIYLVSADFHFKKDTIGSRSDIAGRVIADHPEK